MRVLVIGAKGFVGASLVRSLLRRGHDVAALELRPGPGRLADIADDVEWVTGDGSSSEAILQAIGPRGVDGIYYGPFFLSPAGSPTIGRELEIMATGAWSTFQLTRALDVGRVVFPSSTAVHGVQPDDGAPVRETSRVLPYGLYGAAKLLTERVAHEVNVALGRNVVASVRLPSIYGPGAEIASRRVNVPAVAAARGEVGRVDYRPDARVCIAHVEDAGEILADVFEAPALAHDVYEMGGLDVSFEEIAAAVAAILPGARTEFGDDDRPVLPHAVDWCRLREELGCSHRELGAGMTSIVDYERDRAEVPT